MEIYVSAQKVQMHPLAPRFPAGVKVSKQLKYLLTIHKENMLLFEMKVVGAGG